MTPNNREYIARFLTTEEARAVKDGTYVMSPYSHPPWKPERVTRAYVEEGRTPMFQIAKLSRFGQWLHATGFCLTPDSAVWSKKHAMWLDGKNDHAPPLRVRLDDDGR